MTMTTTSSYLKHMYIYIYFVYFVLFSVKFLYHSLIIILIAPIESIEKNNIYKHLHYK